MVIGKRVWELNAALSSN